MPGSAKYLRPVDGVAGGIPYFRIGTGSPMVFLAPLAESFGGWQRRYQIRYLNPLLRFSTIYVIAGIPTLPAGATMAEIAARYAGAVTELFAEPVDVMGASTGGSLALQLGVDHPELVKRLIVIAAAPRLSALGRSATASCAGLVAEGRPAAGFRQLSALTAGSTVGRFLVGLGLMLGATVTRAGHGSAGRLVATVLKAEVGFDVRGRVGELAMPVLVIAGRKDACYDHADCRHLATRAPRGRLVELDAGHRGVVADRRIWSRVIPFLGTRSSS